MREPRPFFRNQTQSWYVQLDGKQINLGRDKKIAWKEYHALMANKMRSLGKGTVVNLLVEYWKWMKKNRAKSTYARRGPRLRSFAQHVGNLRCSHLRPYHVLDWLDKNYPEAGDTHRATLITAIKGATSWGEQVGYLQTDPLKHLKKPTATIRQEFVPHERWSELLSYCKEPFRTWVEFMLETGCRPEEIMKLQARHLDENQRCLILPISDSKGRKRSRVIWLSERAFQIASDLSNSHPEGVLFRNFRGTPWTPAAICNHFRQLKNAMNMPKLCATTLRHSFAHYRLSVGQDSHIVSKLMGHVNGRMLETRYGHIDSNAEFMRRAANLNDNHSK